MKIFKNFTLIVTIFFTITTSLYSETDDSNLDKQDIIGEVEFYQGDKKVNVYKNDEEHVLNYFQQLADNIDYLIGNLNNLPSDFQYFNPEPLSDSQLLYFASSYLYCITKKGTCEFLLEALLESDFTILCKAKNKICKRPKKVACKNMTRMWKIWIENDLEQRLNHSIPIGLMGKNNDFKQKRFPKYLKCSRTLLADIKIAIKDDEYLSKRYSSSNIKEDLDRTVSFLKAIKENIGNIIRTQGIS